MSDRETTKVFGSSFETVSILLLAFSDCDMRSLNLET